MKSNDRITIEEYMRALENAGNCVENQVRARLVYVDWNDGHNNFGAEVYSKELLNLKVCFEKISDATIVRISISKQGCARDLDKLSTMVKHCIAHESGSTEEIDPVIILNEQYLQKCLAIQIDKVSLEEFGCVLVAKRMWLMNQLMSESDMEGHCAGVE